MVRQGEQRKPSPRMPAWTEPVPVREWMTAPAVTIVAAAPARDAIEIMKARRIRHLPVVESGGRLIGIVTDRDLRQMVFEPSIQERFPEAAASLRSRAVGQVMTWGVVTVGPETPIRQAARLMHERKIGAVPVVDGGRVVGMLTEHDVLRAFASLVNDRTRTVRPIETPPGEGLYEYGFPEPPWGEPWEEEEGPGH